MKKFWRGAALCALWIVVPAGIFLSAQEPANRGAGAAKPGAAGGASAAAIAGSKEDPAAVERGGKLFATNCGGLPRRHRDAAARARRIWCARCSCWTTRRAS